MADHAGTGSLRAVDHAGRRRRRHGLRRREPQGSDGRAGRGSSRRPPATRSSSPTAPAMRSRSRSRPGAPADLFISADLDWMDYLDQRQLLAPGTRVDLLAQHAGADRAGDRATSALKIGPGFGLAAALGGDKLAMANPDSVPAGKYGKSALEKLGVWAGVEKQVARAENVRAALALVVARRGAVRHRLSDRRARRQGRADRRHVSRRSRIRRSSIPRPSSRRASRRRPSRCSITCAPAPRAPIWEKYGFGIGAIADARISAPTRSASSPSACASRSSASSAACRSPFSSPTCLARLAFPGKTLVDAIVHLPLVLPPVVVGFALLVLFGKRGPIGSAARRMVRHRLRVPLDRRGARVRRSWASR